MQCARTSSWISSPTSFYGMFLSMGVAGLFSRMRSRRVPVLRLGPTFPMFSLANGSGRAEQATTRTICRATRLWFVTLFPNISQNCIELCSCYVCDFDVGQHFGTSVSGLYGANHGYICKAKRMLHAVNSSVAQMNCACQISTAKQICFPWCMKRAVSGTGWHMRSWTRVLPPVSVRWDMGKLVQAHEG